MKNYTKNLGVILNNNKINAYVGFALKSGQVSKGIDNITKSTKLVLCDTSLTDVGLKSAEHKAKQINAELAVLNFKSFSCLGGGIKVLGIKNTSLANQISSLIKMEEDN